MKWKSVHELFNHAAEQFGSDVAIRRMQTLVTYSELEERSNNLANFLISSGTSKNSIIALLIEDSIEVITAIIGILKAGCVFVPLDPNIPNNRLAAMISVVSPKWFVIESEFIRKLDKITSSSIFKGKVIRINEESILDQPSDRLSYINDYQLYSNRKRPCVTSEPDDMCYVYFTSGSTGTPKGIAGRLKGIDHFVRWEIKTFGIGHETRISQLTSPSFDALLRDVFVPLCAGGTVCVPPGRDTILDARKLIEWIDEQHINLIHCVPSLFRSIVNEDLRPEYFQSLRYILMAGEPLLPSDVRRWMDVYGDRVQLVNLYGPSETTMTKFFYFVKASDNDLQSIPIGVPMEGAKALIVDAKGNPCRPGRIGEIYIRTPYCTLGYYNQPGLTKEVFIQNPFSDDPNDIVYKTGDLGRILPDGNFEFLGRRDLQVKIRGVRIELREVENMLRSHELVKDVAVMDREDSGGNKYLCAYVVLSGELETSSLRTFLSDQLPEYMIPSAFVVMNALPRTFSGKIDRRALPAPDQQRGSLKVPFLEPRTLTEEMVAGIWSQVLGVKEVGVHDNFFDLGGHSLRITQVVSRLSKAFQVELPLRAFFEAPTVAGLAERIEQISGKGQSPQAQPIVPTRRDGELPLSFAQQRLWFLDRLEPGSAVYNIPAAVRLSGQLNAVALERSLDEMVRRHEVLRTSFGSAGGRPVQIIAPVLEVTVPVVDLQAISEQERTSQARRIVSREAQLPFELTQAPLFRVILLVLGPEDHALLVTMHHIVSDNWSSGVFIQEMAALYRAFCEGLRSPLPELPIQYADFAHWQRQRLEGGVLEAQLGYWKLQLAGAPSVFQLPTDRPRPSVQTFRGAGQSLVIPKDLSEAIKDLSRQHGTSLFMTLLAAFNTLLYRYSNQDDICIGTPIAGRNRLETEGLIGFFANTLVLRTDLSGNPTFCDLLRRVRETCLGAFSCQEIPFEKLVEELQPERDLSHTPLFQVMFVFQNAPMSALELPGLTLSPLDIETNTAAFDVILGLSDSEQGLIGMLDYNTDLFDGSTIERMLEHFRVLLEGIVADPKRSLSDLPLLTEHERRHVLVEFNSTATDYPQDQLVHRLVEAQVERTPGAVAVIFEDEQLTYCELNARANQLAHHLRNLGIGPEIRVGICLERSLEMIIGVLGVLKAGGAYVPLDPAYPKQRLAFILDCAQIHVVLTVDSLSENLPPNSTQVICLDAAWETIAQGGEENLDGGTLADNLAYVIYTSGSTGQPKGVMISHRSVCNTLLWRLRTFSLSESDRILQNIPLVFDPSVWQIFGALSSGAGLVIAQPELHRDSAYINQQIAERKITITDFPPAILKLLLDEQELEEWFSLRCVFCGGEALATELKERFCARSRADLYNQYGPTETSIDATFRKCNPGGNHRTVPIGRPIANKQIYLLDPYLQPVPIGVEAELYIGGEGLARGYVNEPELTAENFIPDPFTKKPGERLYKTGDLARHLAEGSIEFAGRVDRQVKVRGNRIELGEIETALNQHPDVRESAVIAKEVANGDKEIVAFIVPAPQQTQTTAQVRSFLKLKLPDYMLPSKVALLDHLPLTPTGKLDLRALSDFEVGSGEAESLYVGPRSPVEVAVAQIWAQVLGVKAVGSRDNFFELGGHSLLAAQIITRLKEAFGVELPVRAMFDSATVGGLAEQIEAAMKAGRGLQMPPIQQVRRDGKLAVSFAQQRLWFFDQLEPDSSVYNIGAAVRLEGVLDLGALEASLKQIIGRHETLRTSFTILDDEPLQEIAEEVEFRLAEVDLRRLGGAEQKAESMRVAIEERRRPFDLSKSPLMRAKVIKLGAEQNIALLTMHHIISDGWSMGVLIAELTALYQANREGKQPLVPELGIQYADYAQWQREWLTGKLLEEQLGYWKKKLEGSAPVMELPADRPRPAIQTYRGARQEVSLGKELSEGLKQMSRREQVTMFMLLLAAFKVLLYRYSGQTDIVVGTPIANRSRGEIEGLIGYFANTLVLRTELEGEESFQQALRRVRETCLGAYAYEDLPFDKLVEEMQPARDLSYNPLFQVMFELENAQALTGAMKDSGLSLNTIEVKTTTAMFDLTLDLVETPEGMIGSLEYNTDLFDAGTIKRMIGHFQNLLEAVASNPDQSISALAMLTEAERHQLLVEWNDTTKDYALDQTLDGMFEAQVERTPEATALVCEEEHLSYRELNKRANQVARHLQRMGAGPEVLVGICMERSVEMVVGLLGILKSGAAYVPMDPGYPADRLAYMIEDAKAPVLLSQQHLVERLTKSRARVVCLDKDWQAIGEESDEKVSGGAKGDNLAYVIYTSGSTGWPKGAMNTHRGICNRLEWMQEAYGLSEVDRVLQKTPFSFDVSVWEFFWPLITGARLVMARPGGHQDSAYLVNVIEEQEITTLHFVPSMLEVFLQEEELDRCGSVRQVICSGEALSHELQERYFGRIEGALHNLYGPTEAAIDVTYWECERGSKKRSVPIGKPIANTQIYILNGQMEPVPVGVAGELHIGGVGLARGYFNKAEMTGARFVPDAFSEDAGARLYKTGDLARYLEDGEIEYLGRIDHQVKLRGFRIELGEIEAVLGKHEGVRECVVMAREDVPGDTRLVAYVVAESDHQTSGKELRAYLKQQLPDYMLPSAYMMLERMPLTPNGKVDRRALPPPDDTWLGLRASFIAPRDELESQLAQIWEGILDIHPIGITANFFDLGGHSFLAARLMREIHKRFGRKLPLYALFQAATIEHLAGLLRAQTAALTDSPLVPIQTNGSKRPLFCVHEVTGSVRSYFSLARHLSSDQPVYGLRAPDADDDDNDSHITLEGMAAQYIKEMRAVQQEGPYHLAGWSYGGLVAFEMAQQLQEQGQEVALLVLFDTTKPTPSIMDSDIEDQAGFLATLAGMLNLPVTADELRPLDPVERLNFILERAKRIDSHSRGMDIALLRNTFRIIRTNLRASANYMPKFYPHQITLFRSSEMVTENLSKEAVELYNDPALGWNEFSSEPVDIHVIPGNHFTLFAESSIQFVAESLTACLNGTRTVGSHS